MNTRWRKIVKLLSSSKINYSFKITKKEFILKTIDNRTINCQSLNQLSSSSFKFKKGK